MYSIHYTAIKKKKDTVITVSTGWKREKRVTSLICFVLFLFLLCFVFCFLLFFVLVFVRSDSGGSISSLSQVVIWARSSDIIFQRFFATHHHHTKGQIRHITPRYHTKSNHLAITATTQTNHPAQSPHRLHTESNNHDNHY